MIEALVALAIALALSLGFLAPWLWIAAAGALAIAAGLLVGVPTGFWYHVALGRALRAHGALPARWWVRPTAFHSGLSEAERARVLPWFFAGGAGFALTVVGCAALALAALRTALPG